MSKPIKPSKNLVYCYACKRRKMLFEEKSGADNFIKYNHGGILESIKTIEMMVKLRRMELYLQEISGESEVESREDYKKKAEEICHYLTSIKPIVGRKVTGAYRRKLGLCNQRLRSVCYEGRIVIKTRAGHRAVRTSYDTEEVVEDNPGKSFKRYWRMSV